MVDGRRGHSIESDLQKEGDFKSTYHTQQTLFLIASEESQSCSWDCNFSGWLVECGEGKSMLLHHKKPTEESKIQAKRPAQYFVMLVFCVWEMQCFCCCLEGKATPLSEVVQSRRKLPQVSSDRRNVLREEEHIYTAGFG